MKDINKTVHICGSWIDMVEICNEVMILLDRCGVSTEFITEWQEWCPSVSDQELHGFLEFESSIIDASIHPYDTKYVLNLHVRDDKIGTTFLNQLQSLGLCIDEKTNSRIAS